MKKIIAVLFFFGYHMVTHAMTVSAGRASVTVSFHADEGKVYWSWTRSGSGIGTDYEGQVYMYNYAGGTIFETNHTSPGSNSGNFTATVGDRFLIGARNISDLGVEPGSTVEQDYTVEATFSITFTIPPGSKPLGDKYQFLQDGEVIQQYDAAPGDPQSTFVLNGLENNHPVTMERVTVTGEIGEDPLHPGRYIIVNQTVTGVQAVVSGTPVVGGVVIPLPTLPGSTPGGTPTKTPTIVPAAPVPTPTPAAPVEPKAPKPAPPVPSPLLIPFAGGDLTDTGPAKTKDITNAANAIVTGLDAMNLKAADNAGKIVDATNNVADAVSDGANGTITAVNKATSEGTKNANAIIAAINAGRADGADDGSVTGTAFAATGTNGLDNLGSAAIIGGGTGTPLGRYPAAVPSIEKPTASHSITWTITVPKLSGESLSIAKTVDFSASPWATPIAIFRGICQAVLVILFFALGVNTLRSAFASGK